MPKITTYHWRKTTDINREFATFELIVSGVPILSVGFTDAGLFELEFFEAIKGITFEWDRFHNLILEGRKAAENDR